VKTDSAQDPTGGAREDGAGSGAEGAASPEDDRAATPSFDIEALDEKARQAVDFLDRLLDRMDLDARVVSVVDEERICIELQGPDAGRVIGKKGQTLDALQFLVNKVVNRFPEGRRHVVLDVEGYKDRRDESLASMALRLAEKASRTGKVISISPMPARERRVIHLALADKPGVTTRSDGEGAERRVRILPSNRRTRTRK
jgi:spoIIIJ-associated protein